jgi:hypothetical protein
MRLGKLFVDPRPPSWKLSRLLSGTLRLKNISRERLIEFGKA